MDAEKLDVLADLLGEYLSECSAKGLRHLAQAVDKVRNCAIHDLLHPGQDAVAIITQRRAEEPPVELPEATEACRVRTVVRAIR